MQVIFIHHSCFLVEVDDSGIRAGHTSLCVCKS